MKKSTFQNINDEKSTCDGDALTDLCDEMDTDEALHLRAFVMAAASVALKRSELVRNSVMEAAYSMARNRSESAR